MARTPIIRVIDVENGPDPVGDEPGVIEFGYTDVVARSFDLLGAPTDWDLRESHEGWSTLIKPHAPIPPETSAIHNLVDEDVDDAPSWHDILNQVGALSNLAEEIVALAAYGADHEKKFLTTEITGDLPWIDVYKVALRLWPNLDSHSNNAVRYALRPDGLRRELAQPVHRAQPDAYITSFTLREALSLGHSVETLVQWSNELAWIPRCKIGEDYRNGGKGTPWPAVEYSMLTWILKKDFDDAVKAAVRREIDRREIEQRAERELAELNRQLADNGMEQVDRFDAGENPRQPTPSRDAKTLELDL